MCFCFGVGQAKGVLVCGAQCQVCLCAGVRVLPFLGVKVLGCFQAGDQAVNCQCDLLGSADFQFLQTCMSENNFVLYNGDNKTTCQL